MCKACPSTTDTSTVKARPSKRTKHASKISDAHHTILTAHPGTVITLRMLLSHRASINDSEGYFSLDAIDPSRNPVWRKAYNPYAPGTGYMYCNPLLQHGGRHPGAPHRRKVRHTREAQRARHPRLYGGYCVDWLYSAMLWHPRKRYDLVEWAGHGCQWAYSADPASLSISMPLSTASLPSDSIPYHPA